MVARQPRIVLAPAPTGPQNMDDLLEAVYNAANMRKTTIIRTAATGLPMRSQPASILTGLNFARDAILHAENARLAMDPRRTQTAIFDYTLVEQSSGGFATLSDIAVRAAQTRRR